MPFKMMSERPKALEAQKEATEKLAALQEERATLEKAKLLPESIDWR